MVFCILWIKPSIKSKKNFSKYFEQVLVTIEVLDFVSSFFLLMKIIHG